MRLMPFLLVFISFQFSFTQEDITLKPLDSISLKADAFIGVDDFENYYYTKGNTLYKKTPRHTYSYTNTRLGNITSVAITNPLKILVFYRDFNSLIILDNRLNELSDIINLSDDSYGKNAVFATISSNNNLWLYSLDDNILTLWNYETRKPVFNSQPLQFYQNDFEAIAQTSTYENCWMVSSKHILIFNEYGSFIKDIDLQKVLALQPYKNGFLYINGNEIYFHESDTVKKLSGLSPKHLSTNFFVNKNNLYFFGSNTLYRYRF